MLNISDKAVKGVKWTAGSTVIVAVIAVLLQVIKARFLSPEEFASIAAIFIIINFVRMIEDDGFTKGIIQKNNINDKEASSLFYFIVFLSIVMACTVFFGASLFARLFNLPPLKLYLEIISIIVLLMGPLSFFKSFLQKHFMFKEIAIIEALHKIFLSIITIWLLILGWGVLSHVLALIVAYFFSTCSYIVLGIRNRLPSLKLFFSFSEIHFFLRFGALASGNAMVVFFEQHMDLVVVGYILGPGLMGVYYFGKSTIEYLTVLIDKSYNKILFPLFSVLKGDSQRLTDVYYRITRLIGVVVLPVFIGITITAHLFVPILFGEQWIISINVFQVLSLLSIISLIMFGPALNFLYAVNRPDAMLYLSIISTITYFISLLLFGKYGLQAVLFIYATYVVLLNIAMQFIVHRHLKSRLSKYLILFKGLAAIAIVMIIAVVGFQYTAVSVLNDLDLFIGSVIIGLLTYFVLIWIFERKTITMIYRKALR